MKKTNEDLAGKLTKDQEEGIKVTQAAIKCEKDNPLSLATENFLTESDVFQLKESGIHKLQDGFGRNLLHHLAFKGDIVAIISCLASKLFSFHDLDHDYNTPLHYYMMSKKFDVDSLDTLFSTFKGDMFAENKHSVTPLLLLLNALPSEDTKKLYMVLHHLMSFSTTLYEIIEKTNNTAIIKTILGFKEGGELPFQDGRSFERHIATLYYRHHKSEKTPLHMAVINENFEAVKILLEAGANPNARDKEGNTPLHLAVQCKDEYKILDYLLKNRANRDVKNKAGQTPAEYAAALNLKVAEMKIRWKDRQYQLKYCQKLSWPSTDVEWEEVISDAKRFRLAWSKKLLELMIKQLDVYLNGTCWGSYFFSSTIRHSKQATEIKAELKKILDRIDAMIEVIAITHEKDKKEGVEETLDQLIKSERALGRITKEILAKRDEEKRKPKKNDETKKIIDELNKELVKNNDLARLCMSGKKYLDGYRLVEDIYRLLNKCMREDIKQDFIKRDKVPNGVFMISLRHMMLNLQQCQKKSEAIDLKSAGDGRVDEITLTKK